MKKMKREYIKPGISVERLMNVTSLLVGSNNDPYDQHNTPPLKTYTGGDETIDEDDVI